MDFEISVTKKCLLGTGAEVSFFEQKQEQIVTNKPRPIIITTPYIINFKKPEKAFSRVSEENLTLTSTPSESLFPSIFVTAYVQSSLTLYSTT